MPLYEYECESCGHRLEEIQSIKDSPLTTCPKCSKKLNKLLSSQVGFKISGSEKKPRSIKEATKDSQLGQVANFWERYDQVEKLNKE